MKTQDGVPKGGVYLLRVGPRKYYFGVTVNFSRRRSEHLKALRRRYHRNCILQRAFDKHGEGLFRFEPIVWCGPEVAAKTEAWLIQSYVSDENCANLRIENGVTHVVSEDTRLRMSEAQRGRTHSEETRRKISEAQLGKTLSKEHRRNIGDAIRGKTPSEETRRKISAAHCGKTLSKEHRRKIGDASKNRTPETRRKLSDAQRGKRASAETRRKMSEARRGRTDSEETRRKKSEAAKRREAARRAAKANQVAECE